MHSPYRRLRQQMLAVLLLFGLVPLVAVGVASFVAGQAQSDRRARWAVQAAAQGRAAALERFLDARLDALALAAESQPVAVLSTPEGLERVRRLLQREEGGVVDLALLDDAGGVLAHVGPYAKDPPGLGAQGLEETRVLGHHEGDVFLGLGRFPHLRLAVARRDGGALSVLAATIDARALGVLLREGLPDDGTEVLLVDRAGRCQAQCGALPPLAASGLASATPHPGVQVARALRDGRQETTATVWLRHDRWLLVARQALPSLTRRLAEHPVALAAFLLGLLAVPPLSFLVARLRLQQIRGLETRHAELLESVAQSQKMATIGRLAATVAHEINNPLAVIHAQLGVISDCMAAEDTALAREQLERLKKAEAQIERARKVTHRLLGLARRVGPDLEPVDVRAALEDAVGFVEKETEAAGTRIVRDYQLDVPTVRGSLAQMQQVFLNLINNAVDATGAGGEVVLTIRAADCVLVSVADTGPGIAEEQLRHVFEPFYTTKPGHHAGLGLVICREIMQNMGGQIEVAARKGGGTVFTLKFPLAAPGPEPAQGPAS